ncbi:MAG: hypothetical protein AAF223_06935 [Bacteroidota bacterium]
MNILVSIEFSPETQQALCTTEKFYPQHIAFATDLEITNDISYLDFFKKPVLLWQDKVDIIYVCPNPAKVKMEPAQEALNVDYSLWGIPHTYHFIENKFIRGIQRFLMRSFADLMVVVPRHHAELERLFHKSVAN